jgi:hypothetical protein
MAHNKHIIDNTNKEINCIYQDRNSYLKLTKDFKSLLPDVVIKEHEGVSVVREDLVLKGGSKSRAGEFLVSQTKKNTLVYVVPRVGHAGVAIMELAKLYNKDVIFFMPACKEISDHQAHIINMGPKDVVFERIAAMPNLNILAMKYAKQNGYEFLPFGLNHPYTIAGFVRICENILKNYDEPEELWTVVSTGVLTRGLQIGFTSTKMKGICVARNMKKGELGRTEIISEPLPFLKDEKKSNLPEFNTVPCYDGKGWKYVPKNTGKNIWFWNVAGNIILPENFDKSKIKSYKNWNKNLKL